MQETALELAGDDRQLPAGLLGYNTPVPYGVPHENPRYAEALAFLAPGHLRFPGGSVANFFDWRSGQLIVPIDGPASGYRTFMANMAPTSALIHPNGCSAEQFQKVCDVAGAELLWVVNLESSSPADQVDWLKDMAANGVFPRKVELGNEFYLALLGDPTSRRRFPDWQTTNDLSRTYAEALRPHLPPDAKIAAQLAASRFHAATRPAEGSRQEHWDWDDASHVEDWYDAVTAHPYPELGQVVTPEAIAGLPGDVEPALRALLAKADDGLTRMLVDMTERAPGKELWITEWGAGDIAAVLLGKQPQFRALWLHTVARYLLTLTRHPAVTMSSYNSAFVGPDNIWALFNPDGSGGFAPIGPTELLHWFGQAARDATHDRLVVDGTPRHKGFGTTPDETFAETEAAVFRRAAETTAIIHHAGPDPIQLRLHGVAGGDAPTSVDFMATPDLTATYSDRLPAVTVGKPELSIEVPPWTIARVQWI